MPSGRVARSTEQMTADYWARVDQSGGPDACWPWTGADDGQGYGSVWFTLDGESRIFKTHQVAFHLANGWHPRAAEGGAVRHSCDHPPCCNPAHLLGGTQADNIADRETRGRGVTGRPAHFNAGENHKLSKLTADVALEIRRRVDAGEVHQRIADDIGGITRELVSRIGRRIAWKHLPEEAAALRAPDPNHSGDMESAGTRQSR
jgi:hypothetical protein